MAFTYLVLNLIFLVLGVVFLRRSVRKLGRALWITMIILLILTLVFDNLMILAGIFGYSNEKILGIFIGVAPLEDFFYAVFAALIIPALWHHFSPLQTKEITPHGNN